MRKSHENPAAAGKEASNPQTRDTKGGTEETQFSAFDKAMKLFHKRDFEQALPLFDRASEGADLSMAHAAKLHATMCRQRMEKQGPQLKTAEDNYAYGLALTSRRELTGAEQYFHKALEMAPRADYILYSLALVKGLQGDFPSAAAFLHRAVEIQPKNRST